MTDATITLELRHLRDAVLLMARTMGTRLDRAQVAERLGVHRNTLARYIREQQFPAPGRDGKWLLTEILQWEDDRHARSM